MTTVSVPPATAIAHELRYAGLVTRLCALIVDALLLAVAVPIVALGPSAIWSTLTGAAPGWLLVCSQIGAGLFPLIYFTVAWWGTGQTAGDLLFGVVVRGAPDRHVGLCRAFLRALIGLLLPLLWLIGMVAILADPRRRALHDRIFATVVVHKTVQPTRP